MPETQHEAELPCPLCGEPNRAGNKFCRHCGAKFGAIEEPASAVPPPYSPPPPPSVPGVPCPECSISNRPEAKFCCSCGALLGGFADPEPVDAQQRNSAPLDPARAARSAINFLKGKLIAVALGRIAIGAIGLLAFLGIAYAVLSKGSDETVLLPAEATTEATVAAVAPEAAAPPTTEAAVLVLQGTYTAHLSDQDITLTVKGPPSALAQLGAIINYSNVVNGGGCSSALEPEAERSNPPGSAASLKFRQVPVTGQQACPRAIPLSLDISRQTVSADGVVQSVQATWLNPDTGEVLMSGQLMRNATQ